MGPRTSRPPEDAGAIDAIAKQARTHAEKDRLGALALDVLSRQAEARVLFAGREFVDKRAADHDVTHDRAATEFGNVRTMLERGPDTDAERALIACFALVGLEARFAAASAEDRGLVIDRFARHVDWLEAATPYSVWTLVDRVASDGLAQAFWDEVAQNVVDDAGERSRAASVRGRNTARIAALAAATSAGAKHALDNVAASRLDPVTKSVLEAILGTKAQPTPAAVIVRGRVRSPRRVGIPRVLALLSGYAMIAWASRAIAVLAGIRREAELALKGTEIEVHERRYAFGRQIREKNDRVALASVVSAGREVRYPSLHLYVGAIALAIGILVGGTWIFEGARSGELVLLSIGAGLLLGGALLDLALDVLVPANRGRVLLEIALDRGRTMLLDGIAIEDADRFLEAMRTAR